MKIIIKAISNSPKAMISILALMLAIFLFIAGSLYRNDHGFLGLIFTILTASCAYGIQEEAKKIPKEA